MAKKEERLTKKELQAAIEERDAVIADLQEALDGLREKLFEPKSEAPPYRSEFFMDKEDIADMAKTLRMMIDEFGKQKLPEGYAFSVFLNCFIAG